MPSKVTSLSLDMTGEATEETLAEDIATMMGSVSITKEGEPTGELVNYEFDDAFQSKIAAMTVRDVVFNQQTEGLIRPEYFENQAEATLVNLSLEYFEKYKRVPDNVIMTSLIKKGLVNKSIREDMKADIIIAFKKMSVANIADREFVVDEVSTFARHQAMGQAILDSVDIIEKRDFDHAFEIIKRAMDVGSDKDGGLYDYFEEIDTRTTRRKEEVAGTRKKDGITTGMKKLDALLYHHGWGRKELTVFMGAPKSGKSTGLGEFAKFGALAGYNVLYVTLEVSREIISERLDANISDIIVNDLSSNIMEAEKKVKIAQERSGKLMMAEFPTGSMSPSMLRRIISKYKAQGLIFDLICVDYADIMAPDIRSQSEIENSKSIYIGLRAIAQEENLAMLTATQTNREGAKSSVARMEHVAEDFNRIRIADLVISINANEEEKKKGVARLFFAASRNQKGDITVYIRQDFERMQFVKEIIDRAE